MNTVQIATIVVQVLSVIALAWFVILSYHATRYRTKWRYCHWLGKCVVVWFAGISCVSLVYYSGAGQEKTPSDVIQLEGNPVIVTQTKLPPRMASRLDSIAARWVINLKEIEDGKKQENVHPGKD